MPPIFNFEMAMNWRTKKNFKLDWVYEKKIKNQDKEEENKGKNIDGEVER